MKKTTLKKAVSIFLCVSLIMAYLPFAVMAAPGGYVYEGGAGNTIVDIDTSTKYGESLGDNASTEYAGRVWTDKSVYDSDKTFELFGGGTTTIKLNENKNGEDFLVAFSALATSESISGQTQAPVDVVLIIDISGSMSNNESDMDNDKSRIYNTVQATNNAIDELMKLNPYTRVAVAAFSSNAQILLPLDRYTKAVTTERQWVQTGNFSWQGYWDEVVVEAPYFSLNRDTGSSNYATLYTNAVNSNGTTVEKTTSVEGGTNIQMGLYEGMKLLADEDETTANINGEIVKRAPSVIILSDGSPTYSSNSSSWWAPEDNYNDGPGSAPYAGNGMKAILVGAYMKDAIDRNYSVSNTSFATTVYAIGMGISDLEEDEKNLAYMTLDPGTYWNDNNVTNSMKTTIKGYWNSYTARNNTGTLNINVGRYQNNRYSDKNYALTHPNTGYDIEPINGYDYVDDYYDADNASAVTSVFNEIVADIAISAPQVPTEIKGQDPMTDGYLTYTHPLGEYMEVKDIKAIIYAGQTFTAKTYNTSVDKTTYTFAGEVHSAIYGDQELKNIIIEVSNVNGKQSVLIKIPASVIPVRVNEVVLNADGSIKTHTNNGAMPIRIVYSVGLQSKVTKKADNGTVYIDRNAISKEYLDANTNADGTINFYCSEYTNPHLINGSTVGDTTVEFEPSHTNGFYYILEDMPIYKDADFTQQVTAAEGIDDDTVYYYRDQHYHGNSVEITAVERTGAQLKITEIKEITENNVTYLYRAAGSPRLNRILKFEGTKIYNNTNTAEDFYAPEFHYADGSTSAYDGKFIVHLGNNGLLNLTAGGDLQISKTVVADDGLTAPDKSFEFNITLDGENVNQGQYDYIIVDKDLNEVGSGTLSSANTKIYLKDGQTATIHSLPPNCRYNVTETAVDGFETTSSGETGTIEVGTVSIAEFTNKYSIETPVVWPTSGSLKGTKQLSGIGRNWESTDVFTFSIYPYNNAPLPEGYDAAKGVSVDKPDVAGGKEATFNFGNIKFSAPGVYRYTIFENEPEETKYLPGMSYSRALYRVVVTVVDNGDGTLSVASSDIQKLYDDDANQLFSYDSNNQIVMNNGQEGQDEVVFVNTYSAESVTRVPVALKEYKDNSSSNPLVSGMFEFKLEAVGIVEGDDNNATVIDNTASKVPMPEGSVNGAVITSNEGRNVTFPHITYEQDLIPAGENSVRYRYRMSEVIPNGANDQNNYTVNGMTYDNTAFIVDVAVSVDPTTHILEVTHIFSTSQGIPTFRNEYNQTAVYADINGSKILNGRDLKNGESFKFDLKQDGQVIKTATVENLKDGEKKAFSFNDIKFEKEGTYEFTVSENKANTLTAVEYDNTVVKVTVVIADTNKDSKLDVVSITYDNGKNSADFVNSYTSTFNDTPVSLVGNKNLTGKTLLAGEFYFDVETYFNKALVNDGYVSHNKNGEITLLDNLTYTKAGTYEYYFSEIIPEEKVVGTDYDEGKFRYTVVIEDDGNGNLIVKSKLLEKQSGSTFVQADKVEFNNKYTPNPITTSLPLIKKVIAGDRAASLKAGEFEFELKTSANEGIILPAQKIVSNKDNGDIVFGDITFTKAGIYVVTVNEIEPDDADKVAGFEYSKQTITAVYRVVDDRNGTLTATLIRLIGGEIITNTYTANPAEVSIDITKTFTGRENNEWLTTDKFDFELKISDADTLAAIENGNIEIALDTQSNDTATYTIAAKDQKATANIKVNKPGTYKFVVSELDGGIEGIEYDNSNKEVVIVATDDSENALIVVTMNNQDTNKLELNFVNEYKAQPNNPIVPEPEKPDPEQPKPESPQTSDNSQLYLWFALMFVSGGGIFYTVLHKIKRRKEEN